MCKHGGITNLGLHAGRGTYKVSVISALFLLVCRQIIFISLLLFLIGLPQNFQCFHWLAAKDRVHNHG